MSPVRMPSTRNPQADPTAENVRTVLALERRAQQRRSLGAQISERVTRITGTVAFAAGNIVTIAAWIVWNWRDDQFDPYPFSLLTLILSVEAIVLAIFVLMSENQQSRQAEARAQLDLQIDVLAEQELTAALVMLRALCRHHKVDIDVSDRQLQQWLEPTELERVASELDAMKSEAAGS